MENSKKHLLKFPPEKLKEKKNIIESIIFMIQIRDRF